MPTKAKESLRAIVGGLLQQRAADAEAGKHSLLPGATAAAYQLQSSTHAGGFQAEVMGELYKMAKDLHEEWIEAKDQEQREGKIKNLRRRMQPASSGTGQAMPSDETSRVFNHGVSSQYLNRIKDCLSLINRIEVDKQGTN